MRQPANPGTVAQCYDYRALIVSRSVVSAGHGHITGRGDWTDPMLSGSLALPGAEKWFDFRPRVDRLQLSKVSAELVAGASVRQTCA